MIHTLGFTLNKVSFLKHFMDFLLHFYHVPRGVNLVVSVVTSQLKGHTVFGQTMVRRWSLPVDFASSSCSLDIPSFFHRPETGLD